MIHDVPLPRTGSTSTDFATVVSWHVEVGSQVAVGDAIVEVETDKSVVDVESTVAGTVHQLCLNENEELQIGDTLLRVDDGEAPVSAATPTDVAPDDAAEPESAERTRVVSADIESPTTAPGNGRRPIRATPAARRRARELGLEVALLAPGTGPRGRLEVKDVEAAGRLPAHSEDDWSAGLSGARKIIGTRMAAAARQSAPVTLYRDFDVTLATQWVDQRHSQHPTRVLDVVLAVLVRVLRSTPEINAHLTQEGLAGFEVVHLGYAVDGPRGLIVPVLRDAETHCLDTLATARRDIVNRALEGQLAPSDMDGATFTVSNLGPLGVQHFGPIVNLPQVAILGLGTLRESLVVGADREAVVRNLLGVGLTFDHRAVDGAPAARFLDDVARALADPFELLS